ncbi:MAG: NYN domain-containing protein, partial [Lachnospiraceae bacterium]
MENDKRFALLIDADNISPKYIDIILTETVNYGVASVRRIYGDWTDNSKHSWKECLLRNSLTPVQQYSYTTGKNASDSAMIIDAMDILYGNHVDGFIIATSDSDFTTLARRLREDGKIVIGMGESKTPMAFIKACEQFKTLDVLYESEKQAEEEASGAATQKKPADSKEQEAVPITSLKTIRKTVMNIIDEQTEDGEWMNLGELGNILQKRYPDFDCRVYKFSKFSKMVESFQGIELSRMDDSRVMVRQKVTAPKAVSQAATDIRQTAEQEPSTLETVTQ